MLDLYDAALRTSSRTVYRTGQRAYDQFMVSLPSARYLPFEPLALSETELTLAFFMAFLLLRPRITTAGTILNYESHVKSKFQGEGCPVEAYQTPFLRKIRRGIKNTLPSKVDKRGALLLPLLIGNRAFQMDDSKEDSLLRFATIIGFIGMLRPHTFAQLVPKSITVVTLGGRCQAMPNNKGQFQRALAAIRRREGILGFHITFQSKTMREARAYLPSLCSRSSNSRLTMMCPVKALIQLANRGLVSGHFLQKCTKRSKLATYLQRIVGSTTSVAPYALRIGGRTWTISHGLDRQMVDFLGTWKSPDASARYFRGNPRAVLLLVRKFFLGNDPTQEDNAGGVREEARGDTGARLVPSPLRL